MTYGVHRPADTNQDEDRGEDRDEAEDPDPTTKMERTHWPEGDLAGFQRLMTAEGCFTALTALEVWGLDLPPVPEGCPVFMALRKSDPRPLRVGVHTSRHVRPVPFVVVRGLRVATVAEALVATARWVGLVDLVALIDNAIHKETVDLEELVEVSRSRRPGARAVRRSLDLVDGRAESLPESLLRLLHVVCGIDVEPQSSVVHDGVEVARADLRVCGTNSVHEYDGDEHEKRPRRVRDLRRSRRLDRAGQVRRGYTLGDLLHRPATVLHDADRAVGRAHDPARVRAWTALVRDSLYTPAGRVAFLRRIPAPSPRRRTPQVAADCA